MTWKPDYCDLAELKDWLRTDSTTFDDRLADAITTASRNVDGYCNRQFGQITVAADRSYIWDRSVIDRRDALRIDDLYDTTGLVVGVDSDGDGVTNTTLVYQTDFDLWPFNAAADGFPWTHVLLRASSTSRFGSRYHQRAGLVDPYRVNVTGLFGWAAVPTAVKQATLILAAELFARRGAPFGIAGSPELGSEMRLLAKIDPDALNALRQYARGVPGGFVAA